MLHIGNLAKGFNSNELRTLIEKHAEVESVEGRQEWRFGFVTLKDPTLVEDVIAATDGTLLNGYHITVSKRKSFRDPHNTQVCYICGSDDGHWRRECPVLKDERSGEEVSSPNTRRDFRGDGRTSGYEESYRQKSYVGYGRDRSPDDRWSRGRDGIRSYHSERRRSPERLSYRRSYRDYEGPLGYRYESREWDRYDQSDLYRRRESYSSSSTSSSSYRVQRDRYRDLDEPRYERRRYHSPPIRSSLSGEIHRGRSPSTKYISSSSVTSASAPSRPCISLKASKHKGESTETSQHVPTSTDSPSTVQYESSPKSSLHKEVETQDISSPAPVPDTP